MKRSACLLLSLALLLALSGCAGSGSSNAPAASEPTEAPAPDPTEVPVEEPSEAPEETPAEAPEAAAMSHEEYMAAELDSEVVIETYVQATQSWWDNQITVYGQSPDGAYFIYNMACSEEDAAKLVPGTKIRVTGYKTEWSGEVEVAEGATFEIVEGDTWLAEPADVTGLLGTDELIAHQNELVRFKGLTVEKVEYKNGEPGDDIYVTVSLDGSSYDFCVEVYLTGTDTDVYAAVGELKAGDVVDIEGFLYWYEGVNTHITSVSPAA